MAEAVELTSGLKTGIKWPNDLLFKHKKLCGILTELRAEADQMKFVVIGIGLNVNHTASQLPEGATSIRQEMDKHFSRVQILQEILRSFERWYFKSAKGNFNDVLAAWKDKSSTLGKRVRVTDPASITEGVAIDLDSDGGLLIRQDTGVVVKKMAGDVVQLR